MNVLSLSLILLSLIFGAVIRPLQERTKTSDQDAQLRLKADLVQVRAVVTDGRGQPIASLKKEDFELLEENRTQDISFFAVEDIGASVNSSTDPIKNLRNPASASGRTIVLFVDTIHTSFANLARTKRALRKFVDEQMTDRDLVALITSSGALGLMEQFTHDRQLLRAAIERLSAWHVSLQETQFTPYLAAQIAAGDHRSLMLGMEILRQEDVLPKEFRDEFVEPQVRAKATQILAEASYKRRVMLTTLRGVVERAAEMPGQRMIAIFSEGFSQAGIGGGEEPNDLQPTISRAVRSGVVIYAIAAQGLQPTMISAAQPGIVPGRRREVPGRSEVADITSTMGASERDLEVGLVSLSKDTGGEAFFNTNDLSGRLLKALNDNRVYYALGYYARNDNLADKAKQYRKIIVRVRNHPEFKIRTQRGYQLLEAKTEEQATTPRQKLAQALNSPLPVNTIPVAVSADYFERESLTGQAYVQLYIDAGALQYKEQDKRFLFDLETVITIYDLTGKRVHISTNVANGTFTPERLELAKRNGYRYAERVPLKPGIYQARVGILETATEKIGTATGWLEVPDLSKERLSLSSLLLTRDSASEVMLKKTAAGESLSPAVAQGIMIYSSGSDLDYHLIIHPGATTIKPSDIQMQVEIFKDDSPVFQSQWASVESRTVEKDSKGIEVGGSFKLSGIRSGIYQLRVSVHAPGPTMKKPLQRVVSFAVEQ